MSVGAGALSERVTIQQDSLASDGQGGQVATPSTLATVWASVVSGASGEESLQAGAVTAVGRYTVTIRYRADVTAKMRLLWTPYLAAAAKTLEIVASPQPLAGGRAFLVLSCQEVPA